MTLRQIPRVGLTIVFVTIAAVFAWANVDTKGLILQSALRTGSETRYAFVGSFTYSYEQNDRTWLTTYEATVKARWDPMTREASESISYQRLKFEGGEVSARFACSGDPFLAFPGAWPQCKQTNLQIDSQGSTEGAGYWQKMLKDRPLTFRRADPATAKALIAKSSSNNPPPPPPPAPSPSPTPVPGGRPTLMNEVGRTAATQFPNPTWQGRRVDFCLRWSADCGQPAADEFCKRSGFTRSTAWKPAEKIGQTLVLGDNKPCDDPRCDGFASISCVK